MVTDMTVFELQKKIENILRAGGCETPAFDAVCLLEDVGKIGRGRVPAARLLPLTLQQEEAVLKAAERRAAGEPLQYILGTWDFLDLTLEVGKGVLIPRPETELLCQLAAEYLQVLPHKNMYDLCAGSGCVGLSVASLCPSASVTAVELSEKAFSYLQRNIIRYPHLSVTAVQADILTEYDRFQGPIDAIVSNPPYIPTHDLNSLQREVQHEPRMALDGSEDGYRFYRVIAEKWLPKVSPNGFVAVEVGIGQAQTVAELFRAHGMTHTTVYPDFSGIDRIVLGTRRI